jgi:hypothetical protein
MPPGAIFPITRQKTIEMPKPESILCLRCLHSGQDVSLHNAFDQRKWLEGGTLKKGDSVAGVKGVSIVHRCVHATDLSGQDQDLFLGSKAARGGQVSRAGLFYGLSTGEFCPLPLIPSHPLGAVWVLP